MTLRLPLLWAALLFCGGLLVGGQWPSPLWIAASLLLIITLFFTRNRPLPYGLLTVLLWLSLGASRMSVTDNRAPATKEIQAHTTNPSWTALNSRLVMRLQEAGVTDESLSLSAALLLGRKDMVGRDVRQSFRQVGASHLLALSGMHLGIIYGILYLFLLRWGRYGRWRWHLLPPLLLCIWGYALLTGLPPSLVRASLMLTVFTIGFLAEHHQPPLHLLALSALVMLMVSPRSLFDVGFQLSFLAVFFITVLYGPWDEWLSQKRLSWLWKLLGVSLAAQAGTAPLTAYYFHSLPLTACLLSLLLVPLTTLIIWLGVATLLLPCAPLGAALSMSVRCQLWTVSQWERLPGTVIQDIHPTLPIVLLTYALLITTAVLVNNSRGHIQDF